MVAWRCEEWLHLRRTVDHNINKKVICWPPDPTILLETDAGPNVLLENRDRPFTMAIKPWVGRHSEAPICSHTLSTLSNI